MTHYYNEHNSYRAAVLRERMAEGLLPKGVVDERDIETVPDADWIGYTQIHLFAGIGGFPLGLRLAGFPEHRRIITGGFPCQDISNAGKRAGITGSRSGLWREMLRCVRVVRPDLVFVENVAALLVRGMGDVLGDLAGIGYDAEGNCISAADVGAPHLRRRIWIVAYAEGDGRGKNRDRSARPPRSENRTEDVGNASGGGFETCGEFRPGGRESNTSGTSETISHAIETGLEGAKCEELAGTADGRSDADAAGSSRWPVEPDVGRVANGIPKRVDRLAALGDAIVPQCVAEVVRRFVG